MGRHEIIQGSIKIAYGHDRATGYFFSVVDERLAYSDSASEASNEIARSFGSVNDGGGGYFDLNTSGIGFGRTVDVQTLLHFWKVLALRHVCQSIRFHHDCSCTK
ncbi:hypothetical protein BDV98DRAFT_512428 [Pterulicium gracile]|uniref:Uncharacterized protein n=1 Tax=Pterulicium gracile TaxID=1884261 RepID=A0A5C3QDP6_9AGAR|nr:hypothetical protein BDV98DRAFT_512428 [Pterula gracilis]